MFLHGGPFVLKVCVLLVFRLFMDVFFLVFQGGWLSASCLLWLLRGCLWLLISHPLHSHFLSVCLCGFMRLLRLWLFASSALPVSLRQVAFWLCGFWWLSGFGFSHPLLSQFVGLGFQHPQHRQFLSGAPRHPPFD